MGGQQSNPAATYYERKYLPLIEEDITNKILDKPFETQLFTDSNSQKSVNIINLQMLVDILGNSSSFSNTTSSSEAFSKVILRAIQSFPSSKPLFQQLMSEYNKYLQTRGESVLEQQEIIYAIRNDELKKYENKRAEIIPKSFDKPKSFPTYYLSEGDLEVIYDFVTDLRFNRQPLPLFPRSLDPKAKQYKSLEDLTGLVDYGFGIRHAFIRAVALSKLNSKFVDTKPQKFTFKLFPKSKIENTTNFNNYFGFFSGKTYKSSLVNVKLLQTDKTLPLAYWNGNLLFFTNNDELYSLDMKKNDPNEIPYTKLLVIQNVDSMAVSNDVLSCQHKEVSKHLI